MIFNKENINILSNFKLKVISFNFTFQLKLKELHRKIFFVMDERHKQLLHRWWLSSSIWYLFECCVEQIKFHSKSFKLNLNKFACLTPQEYKALIGIKTPFMLKGRKIPSKINTVLEIPDNYDYREKRFGNEIKNQGWCGGCILFL